MRTLEGACVGIERLRNPTSLRLYSTPRVPGPLARLAPKDDVAVSVTFDEVSPVLLPNFEAVGTAW